MAGRGAERPLAPEQPVLQVVVASTRPGRVGLPVARWFSAVAAAHGAFRVETADLAEIALPFLDEPEHPRHQQYLHDHTKRWSAQVAAADAHVLVTPEYNHSYPAALKNALDFLHHEWQYKPVGFVSYGGLAAGTRAVQALKPVLTGLKMVPLVDAVAIPFVAKSVSDGEFHPADGLERSAHVMLDELLRVSAALELLRPARPAADT